MITIKETKFGLKKGQRFEKLKTDGQFAVFKGKRKVAFLPINLLGELKLHYENGYHSEL